MKTFIGCIEEVMMEAFKASGYEEKFGKVTVSNRPDLCEYQCNGAMAAAKAYRKAPIMIANDVVEKLQDKSIFESAQAVNPGFINLKLDRDFLASYLNQMTEDENLSVEKTGSPKTIVIDYGGPNVAKPLHVGHLRSAIIGESIKRMGRFLGHKVIGDVPRDSRIWYISIRITRENTPRKRLLQSANWRRFILQPARDPRKMRTIKTKPWRPPWNFSREGEATELSGSRS